MGLGVAGIEDGVGRRAGLENVMSLRARRLR